MLALLFGAISLLYATVGQAGGTSFLALMAFASFSPSEMRPTAFMLNIVAASYTTWLFNRVRLVDWKKLTPLLASSLPMAVVGGLIVLNEQIYKTITGLVFLVAAVALAFQRTSDGELKRPTPLRGAISIGAVIGFVSGLTGVGGGLFLAPLLIALQWASPKQTAALSAPFNLANSVLGLLGVMYAGQAPTAQTWMYAIAAAAGAIIGTSVGLRWLSHTMTRYILAVVLGAAGIQFLFFSCRSVFRPMLCCVTPGVELGPRQMRARADAHEPGGGSHRGCAIVTVEGRPAANGKQALAAFGLPRNRRRCIPMI